MSRIGKKIISLPKGVSIEQKGTELVVKGPKGSLAHTLPTGIQAKIEGTDVSFTRSSDVASQRADRKSVV